MSVFEAKVLPTRFASDGDELKWILNKYSTLTNNITRICFNKNNEDQLTINVRYGMGQTGALSASLLYRKGGGLGEPGHLP